MDNTVKISQLPEATEISPDSLIPAVVNGTTSAVKAEVLQSALQAQIDELKARPVPAFEPYFESQYIPSLSRTDDDPLIKSTTITFDNIDKSGKYLVIANSLNYETFSTTGTEGEAIGKLSFSITGLDADITAPDFSFSVTPSNVTSIIGSQMLVVTQESMASLPQTTQITAQFTLTPLFKTFPTQHNYRFYANNVYVYLLRVG